MAKITRQFLDYNGTSIPLDIYIEHRRNVRVSIGRESAILRLPVRISKRQFKNQIYYAENWIKENLKKDPGLLERFEIVEYRNRKNVITTAFRYKLNYREYDRRSATASLDQNVIVIKAPVNFDQRKVANLISRVVGEHQYPRILKRTNELNQEYINRPFRDVKLKYNKSNWGSCSSKGYINISTRLLKAPYRVQDYVILHELAHLIHANHSKSFWKVVESGMPDYKQSEKWLKENERLCYF